MKQSKDLKKITRRYWHLVFLFIPNLISLYQVFYIAKNKNINIQGIYHSSIVLLISITIATLYTIYLFTQNDKLNYRGKNKK